MSSTYSNYLDCIIAMLGSPEHCRFGGVSASTAVMPPLTYNAIPALLLPSTLFFPSSSLSLTFSQPPSTHRLYLLSRQLIQTIFSCDSGLSARCVFSSVLPRVLISQHHHSLPPTRKAHTQFSVRIQQVIIPNPFYSLSHPSSCYIGSHWNRLC